MDIWVQGKNGGINFHVFASGVLASIVIIGCVLWTGAIDVGFHQKGRLFNLSGIPTIVSLYALYYCAHPIFPTLYTSMRHPH